MTTTFPVAVVSDGTLVAVHRYAAPFTGSDGVKHPAAAWTVWTAEDWLEKCPGWTRLPLIEPLPPPAGYRAVPRPESEWLVGEDGVAITCDLVAIPMEERRLAVVRTVNAERNRRLAEGAPYAGKLIDVSDKGRADLAGMSLAALLAAADPAVWTGGYSTGWITQDNSRIELPTPADGLALAAAVGYWYGGVVQHARNLKDAALASDVPEVIDVTAGWPEGV
jgi:hypothetical protein